MPIKSRIEKLIAQRPCIEIKLKLLWRLKWNLRLPARLQRSRKLGASGPYWFIMPFWDAFGNVIVSVIGLWNLRRRGSIVTIGLTATRLPNIFATKSAETGWTWTQGNYREIELLTNTSVSFSKNNTGFS